MTATMRAAQFGRYGGPDELTIGTVARPEPGPGQVRVRVEATSVNGGELLFRSGRLRLLSGRKFPKGLGSDLAGVVDAAGPGVTSPGVGQTVWGVLPSIQFVRSQAPAGAAADYVVVPADHVADMPARISFVEAAALPTVATTALTAVRDVAKVRAGEQVLVRGAAGGVGSSLVQLAASRGARVTALTGSTTMSAVRSLGAEEVHDYRSTPVTSLTGFDIIFDTVGSSLRTVRSSLAPRGRMVALALNPAFPAILAVLASAAHGKSRIRFFSGKPSAALLTELSAEVRAENLRPVIDHVYPLADIAAAHRAAERGGRCGKQVIAINDDDAAAGPQYG